MHANDSPIQSLQQLKDLLDTGALTRQEFEFLKQKLISSLLGDDETKQASKPTLSITAAPEADKDEGLLPLTSYELVEEPQPASDPPFGELPPLLDVDHLLAPAEENPTAHFKKASIGHRTQGSHLDGLPEGASPVVLEPGKEEDAAYISSQEEEPRSGLFGGGNLLNAMLVASILSLAVFGGYIYVNQQKWESEQIISRGTQRTGGLAPAVEQAELSSPTAIPAEGTAGGEEAATRRQPAADPAVTPPSGQERPVAEPVAPAEAPAAETAKPAAAPSEPKADPAPGRAAERGEEEPEKTPVSPQRASPPPQNSSGGEEGIEGTVGPDGAGLVPAGKAEQGILNQIGNRLRRYYVDYQAKPFGAKDHFAPKVERYFTLTRVTPAAISENLEQNRGNEILEGRYSFDPSSIRSVKQGKGSYEVLFVEYGQAILKSTQEKQETAVWIRARFDKNFRITYFQQERPVKEEVAEL